MDRTKEGACLIFGMRNPDEPEGFNTSVDWGFIPTLSEVACQRLPILANTGITGAQAGLHVDTPDHCAVIGKVTEVEGLYLACGFSGHGFMHSPAVGKIVAELVLDGVSSLDASSLSLDRFGKQAYHKERSIV